MNDPEPSPSQKTYRQTSKQALSYYSYLKVLFKCLSHARTQSTSIWVHSNLSECISELREDFCSQPTLIVKVSGNSAQPKAADPEGSADDCWQSVTLFQSSTKRHLHCQRFGTVVNSSLDWEWPRKMITIYDIWLLFHPSFFPELWMSWLHLSCH